MSDPGTVVRSADLETLLSVLDLEQIGDDTYRGRHPNESGSRTFGGQLVAQALVAADRTVDGDRPIHAINAHFIRGGNVKAPIEYRVERHRDGRAFANRQVTAYQDGNVVFSMFAAFQDGAGGLEHGVDMPDVPAPEDCLSFDDHIVGYEEKLPHFVEALHPMQMRYANPPTWVLKDSEQRLPHNRVWIRTDGDLPDTPWVHSAALAYASDTTVLDSILTTHGLSWGLDRIVAATVNHSIWFHRPFRFDEWALYATESPVASGSRGLGRGHFFDRTGEVIATVVQEGVIRHFPPRR
ncbi:acyl-CoA thioesterase II [Prescottella sp. R16]|uniref:acyl-CoA thioesterase n=1 Tax=Prescottella sp. R16 TaxID=3064529 RepID=UPI00272E5E74|nr:acyl-CoA thioesterase II [Prescottella sp. R16]